jgi:predicted TIM-barrel enzyme
MNRGKILEAWRRKRSGGARLEGGRSGPDFIAVSNEDKLDLPGARGIAGLLPLGDANALSLAAAKERIAAGGAIPILAGVCATDPLRLMDKFLQEMKAAGVAGVQNAPSVGLIDGGFRTNLEEARLGYAKEVELIRLAAKMDLIASALVFSPEDARAMAGAGADLLVIHPGIGPRPAAKERDRRLEEIAEAGKKERRDLLVLAFGSAPEEVGALDGIQIE